jgi:hypothetical protein
MSRKVFDQLTSAGGVVVVVVLLVAGGLLLWGHKPSAADRNCGAGFPIRRVLLRRNG